VGGHELGIDGWSRSSISVWRKRMGEEGLQALLQESLAVATRTGAMKPADLSCVIVDTTMQPKNITFLIDAKLDIWSKATSIAPRKGCSQIR
jgi:IS5 family transposase